MKNMENKNGENKMKKIDANRLSDAIGEIDESLIAEYETKKISAHTGSECAPALLPPRLPWR